MSVGSTTFSVGRTIVTDQQVEEAKRIVKEYQILKQKGKVTDEFFKKFSQASLFLEVSIAQDMRAIEASQKRVVVLKAQDQQDINTISVQLKGLLGNINQRETAKLQQLPTAQRSAFVAQVQHLKQAVADAIAKNSRGERADLQALQAQYKAVFS